MDSNHTNFFGWQGRTGYWPRTFVLDREGRIRFDHHGEGRYDEIAAAADALLAEA